MRYIAVSRDEMIEACGEQCAYLSDDKTYVIGQVGSTKLLGACFRCETRQDALLLAKKMNRKYPKGIVRRTK